MIIAPMSLSSLTNQTPSLTAANQDDCWILWTNYCGCSIAVTCKQVGYKYHKLYAKFVNERILEGWSKQKELGGETHEVYLKETINLGYFDKERTSYWQWTVNRSLFGLNSLCSGTIDFLFFSYSSLILVFIEQSSICFYCP